MAQEKLTIQKLLNNISDGINRCYKGITITLQGKIKFDEKAGYRLLDDSNYFIDLDIKYSGFTSELIDKLVEVSGTISSKSPNNVSGSSIRLEVETIKIIDNDEEIMINEKMDKEIQSLISKKTFDRAFFKYFSNLLSQKQVINIAVIHGRNSQVQKDFVSAFQKQVGKYENRVKISTIETTLSNDDKLSSVLSSVISDYDAVFVLRGGGSYEDLSKIGLLYSIKFIVAGNIPLFTALGHSNDKYVSYLQKVSDYDFQTPSLAGTELGEVVRFVCEKQEKEEEIKILTMQLQAEKISADSYKEQLVKIHSEYENLCKIIDDMKKASEEQKLIYDNTLQQMLELQEMNNKKNEELQNLYTQYNDYTEENIKLKGKMEDLEKTIIKLYIMIFISAILGFALGITFIKLF